LTAWLKRGEKISKKGEKWKYLSRTTGKTPQSARDGPHPVKRGDENYFGYGETKGGGASTDKFKKWVLGVPGGFYFGG